MHSRDVVPLPVSLLDAAADVLVRSFAADPGLLFVLPDGVAREQLAPIVARAMMQFVLRTGTPYCAGEPVRGVALWFPPGGSPPSEEDFSATRDVGHPGSDRRRALGAVQAAGRVLGRLPSPICARASLVPCDAWC